jgi:NB-ARC domain
VVDGGRVAAGGFLYQYLRTLEAALVALSDERVYAVRVEGDPNPSEATDSEVVDFDLIDDQGAVLLAAQVKSGASGAQLGLSSTFRILVNLVKIDAPRYELLTNTRISADTVKLMQVLRRDETVAERRAALDSVLDRKPVHAHLADLSDEYIHRLGRCKLSVDMRERAELNDTLRQALRVARQRLKRGIGQQSSGLLLAYLQSEVHRRAASPEDAVWTMSGLLHDLSLDDQALVDTLGARDWGGVLGLVAPIPDVPRTALLTELADALEPYRPTGRTPRRCALTGLSGIGKSSLAVAYLAEYADAYENLFWIDASSPDAIVRDLRLIASRLDVGLETDDPHQLRSLVHESLSTRAGRWLMVFDDAQIATATPWMPRIGDGDVLITSIDTTLSVNATGGKLQVTVMEPDEAVQLLTARLELTVEQATANVDLVRRLASALEYWPLALELAASYMRNCVYNIADVSYYLDSLKIRSLGDQHSIPEGYPRTLVAAIDLAAETLYSSESALVAKLAGDMLARACYLANRHIPIHLLVAASDPDFDTLPSNGGPAIIENPLVQEAVRALRRISFVNLDQPLTRQERDTVTSGYTIAINSVLQEVLRARIEANRQRAVWVEQLERLARHLNTWLSAATHNGEADKAHELLPHAATLIGHLQRWNIASNSVALLVGNIAGVHSGMKRSEAAVELLNTQLQIIMGTNEPDEFLVHQTRLHLAYALVAEDDVSTTSVTQAIHNLECVQQDGRRGCDVM